MITHYLIFDRNCEEALKTYEKAFGGKITEIRKYKDMPVTPSFPIPESDKELVLHSRIVIDGTEMMAADSAGKDGLGSNMYVSITTKDIALVKKAWEVLAVNAEVYMELNPSFFAELHGSLKDQFGINWMFTAEK